MNIQVHMHITKGAVKAGKLPWAVTFSLCRLCTLSNQGIALEAGPSPLQSLGNMATCLISGLHISFCCFGFLGVQFPPKNKIYTLKNKLWHLQDNRWRVKFLQSEIEKFPVSMFMMTICPQSFNALVQGLWFTHGNHLLIFYTSNKFLILHKR